MATTWTSIEPRASSSGASASTRAGVTESIRQSWLLMRTRTPGEFQRRQAIGVRRKRSNDETRHSV